MYCCLCVHCVLYLVQRAHSSVATTFHSPDQLRSPSQTRFSQSAPQPSCSTAVFCRNMDAVRSHLNSTAIFCRNMDAVRSHPNSTAVCCRKMDAVRSHPNSTAVCCRNMDAVRLYPNQLLSSAGIWTQQAGGCTSFRSVRGSNTRLT